MHGERVSGILREKEQDNCAISIMTGFRNGNGNICMKVAIQSTCVRVYSLKCLQYLTNRPSFIALYKSGREKT